MQEKKNEIPPALPQSSDRRTILKKTAAVSAALAGYSVLPARWISPEITLATLPAHAQTSPPVGGPQTTPPPQTPPPPASCHVITVKNSGASVDMNGEPVTINISQYTACGGTSNGSFSLAPSQSKTISVKPGTGFTLDLGSAIRAQIKFNGSGSHPAISWKQPDPLSGTVKISTGGSPATVTMEVTTVP